MKLRIAMWACAGALVALIWALYIAAIFPSPLGIASKVLIYLTFPISIAGHYPLSFYIVLLMNAATYALVGTVVEAVRGRHRRVNPA